MLERNRKRDLTEELEALKRKNEKEKQKKARLEGKLDILKSRMEEYDCDTLAQLEALLEKKKLDETQTLEKLEEKMREFDGKYKL